MRQYYWSGMGQFRDFLSESRLSRGIIMRDCPVIFCLGPGRPADFCPRSGPTYNTLTQLLFENITTLTQPCFAGPSGISLP